MSSETFFIVINKNYKYKSYIIYVYNSLKFD